MGTLTKNGYEIKTQNEYFAEEQELYKAIDPNFTPEPSSPDGMKIAHDAEVFGALDELIKQAYDARDPNKASGYDLDVLRKLTGATRSQGTPSTVTLKMTGASGTLIPKGSQAKTKAGVIFETDEDLVLATDGIGTVSAHCTKNGAIEVNANSITEVVTLVSGWQTVTNPQVATLGTARDSDALFRVKSARSVSRAGIGQKDSLYGELYETEGVRKVRIYENKTDSGEAVDVKNPHGLPAHSLAIVVDGGQDSEVARAIYNKLIPGVNLHAVGTEVTEVVWSEKYRNSNDVITFSRPIYVDVGIHVVVADPMLKLPSQDELQSQIAQAYIDYYEGNLLPDGIGFMTTGFDIGEIVPYTRLFTPANKVLGEYQGAYVKALYVNGDTENVGIRFNELARFTTSNITVTIG